MQYDVITENADLITIGGIVNRTLNDKSTNRVVQAKAFIRTVYGHAVGVKAIHRVMKNLSFGRYGTALLRHAKNADIIYTQPIQLSTDHAHATVTLYTSQAKSDIMASHGTWLCELFDVVPGKFAVIDKLESVKKDAGTRLLTAILSSLNGIPVFLQAGWLYEGDGELERREILKKLKTYYGNTGFEDINDHFGYENAVIMYHKNDSDFVFSDSIRVRR